MISRRFVGTICAFAALGLTGPAAAGAVVITPTTTADEYNANPGACSLREAIESANEDSVTNADGCVQGSGADVVELRPGTVYTLSIPGVGLNATGDLDIHTDDLTIRSAGPGAVIDGNGTVTLERVIKIANIVPPITATIQDVTVRNGGAALGAVGSDNGGGIAVFGATQAHTLNLIRSTVSGNRGIDGGGLKVGATGTVNIVNSTISGNRATVDGGALDSEGTTTLDNTTVTANDGNAEGDFIGDGGGVSNDGGTISLRNSIVAGNRDLGQDATNAPDCTGDVVQSQGYALVGNTGNCMFDDLNDTDVTGVDARLGPLADNGGRTRTHALFAGSPAINRANPGDEANPCEATDQRDLARVLGGRCDIGAYERVSCRGVAVNRIGTGVRDVLNGTAAADGFLLFGGNDVANGKRGSDRICGGRGSDRLLGGPGRDLLVGGAGRDRLFGGKGRDRLIGGGGRDRLFGGVGRDRLFGGKGRDRCFGGPGRDRALSC